MIFKKLHSIIFFSICLNVIQIQASEFKNFTEEELYQEGVRLRNAAKSSRQLGERTRLFEEAQKYFLPLAQKGGLKAAHNLAHCAYFLKDDETAYKWFSFAAQRGFEPSSNNLNKLDLFNLLLPNELILKIASYLKMKDFGNFEQVSTRVYQICQLPGLKGGLDLQVLLKNITFTPPVPEGAISIENMISTRGGMRVHFRDTDHLAGLIKKVPEVKAKAVFFVRDLTVEDGKEFRPYNTNAPIVRSQFLYVKSPVDKVDFGSVPLCCSMFFLQPLTPELRNLSVKSGRKGIEAQVYNALVLSFANNATELIGALGNFNEANLVEYSEKAFGLLQGRHNERKEHPERFPTFDQVSQNFIVGSDKDLEIHERDYVEARGGKLIYAASFFHQLGVLEETFPTVMQGGIAYIDPSLRRYGVFSHRGCVLEKGFVLKTQGSVAMSGELLMRDNESPTHNFHLYIQLDGKLWMMGVIVKATSFNLNGAELVDCKDRQKPDGMPQHVYEKLQEFWKRGEDRRWWWR